MQTRVNMADVDDGDSASSSAAQMAVTSPEKITNYLKKIIPVILEDYDGVEVNALEQAFGDKHGVDSLKKFIGDPQTRALLVSRIMVGQEDDDNDSAPSSMSTAFFAISTDVHYTNHKMSGVVCVKRGPVVEAEKAFSTQLRLMTLSEGSPYETLHDYVAGAVSPYFKSFVRDSGKADREGDKMAASMEKKIAELEMGLLHLQQNIDIPEITLTVHPFVSQVIKKALDGGIKPKVADFGDKVEDSTFLNALQNQVSKWIREIQKVTKLDRDPSSGTALQEISFWLNLERALLRIQEKRESSEVALTLDVLKHGKRFHATVSFDTDTGLKQAIATVNDYNPLMKDFPINDLLSATELDRIRISVKRSFHI